MAMEVAFTNCLSLKSMGNAIENFRVCHIGVILSLKKTAWPWNMNKSDTLW